MLDRPSILTVQRRISSQRRRTNRLLSASCSAMLHEQLEEHALRAPSNPKIVDGVLCTTEHAPPARAARVKSKRFSLLQRLRRLPAPVPRRVVDDQRIVQDARIVFCRRSAAARRRGIRSPPCSLFGSCLWICAFDSFVPAVRRRDGVEGLAQRKPPGCDARSARSSPSAASTSLVSLARRVRRSRTARHEAARSAATIREPAQPHEQAVTKSPSEGGTLPATLGGDAPRSP
jgi:hypothetical protein